MTQPLGSKLEQLKDLVDQIGQAHRRWMQTRPLAEFQKVQEGVSLATRNLAHSMLTEYRVQEVQSTNIQANLDLTASDLRMKGEELGEREATIKTKEEALEKREVDAKTKEDRLEKREANIKKKEAELDKREADIKKEEEGLEKREAGLDKRKTDLDEQDATLQQAKKNCNDELLSTQNRRETLEEAFQLAIRSLHTGKDLEKERVRLDVERERLAKEMKVLKMTKQMWLHILLINGLLKDGRTAQLGSLKDQLTQLNSQANNTHTAQVDAYISLSEKFEKLKEDLVAAVSKASPVTRADRAQSSQDSPVSSSDPTNSEGNSSGNQQQRGTLDTRLSSSQSNPTHDDEPMEIDIPLEQQLNDTTKAWINRMELPPTGPTRTV
ncbi:MAG: hypothetical protein Q9218_008173 [Villophora microphyllina]